MLFIPPFYYFLNTLMLRPMCTNLRKELNFALTKTNKEKLFQMTTIAELCPVLQGLLIETANRLAKETGFIQRERQLTGAGFAQSTVLGWLNQPDCSRSQLHHAAVKSGMQISLQGFDKRFSTRAVVFMPRSRSRRCQVKLGLVTLRRTAL